MHEKEFLQEFADIVARSLTDIEDDIKQLHYRVTGIEEFLDKLIAALKRQTND